MLILVNVKYLIIISRKNLKFLNRTSYVTFIRMSKKNLCPILWISYSAGWISLKITRDRYFVSILCRIQALLQVALAAPPGCGGKYILIS